VNSALAAVLARPDIWRGDAIAVSPAPTFSSGFAELDAELPGGGWPRGNLTELLYEQSGIGEVSLLLPALARLTAAGGAVVLIAPAESASSDYGSPAPLRLRLAAQGDALRVDVLKRRGMPLRHSLRLTITRPASLRHVPHAVADTLPRVPGRPLSVVA
jgi:hypothetical protein